MPVQYSLFYQSNYITAIEKVSATFFPYENHEVAITITFKVYKCSNIHVSLRETQVLRRDSVHESQRVALNGILIATLRLEQVPKGRDKYFNILF